jgi:3'(2'), 5'-bisphosphate nucleotidase
MDFSAATGVESVLVMAALEAGVAILDIYAAPVEATCKADGSPVTLADERAEAILVRHLAALGLPVVAEEAVAGGQVPVAVAGEKFFLVDPLDGTKEFLSRNGEFTVNIALIEGGKPVLGVVYAPALGVIYVGARRGQVVQHQVTSWEEIAVAPVPTRLRVIGSRSHSSAAEQAFVNSLPVAERVAAGSSLKFCRLAEGAADFYPRLGRTMEWDIAAGHAVLAAAGGAVKTLDGADMVYGKPGFENPSFVATTGFDWNLR